MNVIPKIQGLNLFTVKLNLNGPPTRNAKHRILVVHYSRTGHTTRLAGVLAKTLRDQGHEVASETIRVEKDWNKWLLPLPLLPLLPFLPLYLVSAWFRRVWHRIYLQQEQSIRPLFIPDVSSFDMILLGTPKWLYISYPVARWLSTIKGLSGKRVANFATFCGPPLKVFEIEMLFEPLEARLRGLGATVGERLAISSDYHPYFFFDEMRSLFRWLSMKVFGRPLNDFTLDGEIGSAEVHRFCSSVIDV